MVAVARATAARWMIPLRLLWPAAFLLDKLIECVREGTPLAQVGEEKLPSSLPPPLRVAHIEPSKGGKFLINVNMFWPKHAEHDGERAGRGGAVLG